MRKVIISADSTCDIGPELAQEYDVQLLNWKIELDGKVYLDNVELTPDEMYEICRAKSILPKSSGANPQDYMEHWKPWVDDGYDVVHLSLPRLYNTSHQSPKEALSFSKSGMPFNITKYASNSKPIA